jgi:hypothetical protein
MAHFLCKKAQRAVLTAEFVERREQAIECR